MVTQAVVVARAVTDMLASPQLEVSDAYWVINSVCPYPIGI